MMRIALVTRHENRVTGLSRYGRTLAHYLQKQQVEIVVLAPQTELPSPLLAAGKKLGWDLKTFFEHYPLRLSPPPADVYHLTTENLATLLVAKRFRPTIVTVHAFFTFFLRHNPELNIYSHSLQALFDRLTAHGLKQASAIIAVSHFVKSLLVNQLSIPAERIHVVHEGVDHSFFYPRDVSRSFRLRHGLDPNYQYILYVGSEQPRKNFLALLRAFSRVRAELPRVRLLKVGQPELQTERTKAIRLIQSLGIENSVLFFGHVNRELPLFYSVADVFAFPSLYEGFGFPPLEAMACGTPVICSNTTSLPEVVGESALLFEPTNEDLLVELLRQALTDQVLRETYRKKGMTRAAKFSWDESARETARVYEVVVG